MGLEEIEGDFPQDCDVFGAMVFAVPRAILSERDIKHPVEAVLDMPVLTDDFEQYGKPNTLTRDGGL
jgi:hypothetical protein